VTTEPEGSPSVATTALIVTYRVGNPNAVSPRQNFDGDVAIQLRVARTTPRHAARGEGGEDLV
jgi:hypothetical protein